MELKRRSVLGLAAASAMLPAAARAAGMAADEVLPLWPRPPHRAGGALRETLSTDHSRDPRHPDRALTGIGTPRLVIRRPRQANGCAVLIIPGGGYAVLSVDNEGHAPAERLAAQGFLAAILLYRLPGEGWDRRTVAPLADARRAVRLLRGQAGRLGIRPDRIAALGFSAGGHLAGLLATADADAAPPTDALDRLPARPDVAGLLYPVVSMARPFAHPGSRDALLGPDAPAGARAALSLERRVTAETPPLFIAHAADDEVVPVANSLALHAATLAARRPAELHVFAEGGHGFGVRLPDAAPAARWPDLFARFVARSLARPLPPPAEVTE